MRGVVRREGLLAPRSTFVNVVINGRPNGIYYLEEHFSKEMLESQGRRDGAIVKLLEDTLWSTWQQYGYLNSKEPVPPIVKLATSPGVAEVAAFDEKRLAKVDSLNARLQRALMICPLPAKAALGTLRRLLIVNDRFAEWVRPLIARSPGLTRTRYSVTGSMNG